MKKRKPSRGTRSPKYREYLEPVKDPDDSGRPPLKKRKSTNRVDRVQSTYSMELYDFQTPHPTVESQSQVFKLPSSSPQPSPRALSPVPGTLPTASRTSSKYFKENAPKQAKFPYMPEASSTPWNRHSSNSFASMGRMSGHIPPIPFSRKSRPRSGRHRPSRSHSRSSSNSNSNVSSRANSKEPHARKPRPHNPTQKIHLAHESKLKHTQSLSSLDPTKNEQLNHPKAKPSSRKSAAPRHGQLSLASPFVSRASSPVEQASGAHIPTHLQPEHGDQSKKRIAYHYGQKSSTRGALTEIHLEPNLPDPAPARQSTRDAQPPRPTHRGSSWLQNVQSSLEIANAPRTFTSPKKLDLTETTARKARSSTRVQPKMPAKFLLYAQARNNLPLQEQEQVRERERRPSAPSSLHVPKELRLTGGLSVLGPGRTGGGNHGAAQMIIQGKENDHGGVGEMDGQRLLAAAAPGDAKPASSGVHAFLDKLRHSSAIAKNSVGDANVPAIPPTPVKLMDAPAMQTLAEAKPSRVKPLPSSTRQFLHPSASMDDLHTTGQGRSYSGEHDRSSRSKHAAVAGISNDDDDDDRTAWMHVRSGVDFNRPPSQMEVGAPGAAGIGFGYADAEYQDTIFTSSESEGESAVEGVGEGGASSAEDEYAHEGKAGAGEMHAASRQRGVAHGLGAAFGFGFGFENPTDGRGLGSAFGDHAPRDDEEWARFGEDAWGVSTPAKDLILLDMEEGERQRATARRVASFPSLCQGEKKEEGLRVQVGVVLARSVSYDDLERFHEEANGDTDVEEDMDLTGSAALGRLHRGEEKEEDGEASGDSWITDSLISPPTAYLERKREQELPQDQEQDEDNHTKEQKSSSALDGPSFRSPLGLPAGPGLPSADAQQEDSGHEFEDGQSSESHTYSSSSGASTKTATRTRSGTIVPANPLRPAAAAAAAVTTVSVIPPGSRRTRSGTIVGPLPAAPPPAFALPARPDGSTATAVELVIGRARVGAAPIRTRSGTIVASASVPRAIDGGIGSGLGQNGLGRVRNGSLVQGRFGQGLVPLHGQLFDDQLFEDGQPGGADTADADQEKERDDVVECYADSLYVPAPADASSPDPIDFLRFASIAEAENEEDDDLEWRVVRKAASPRARKDKQQRGRGGALRGLATRAASAGRWLTRGKSTASSKTGAGARKGLKVRKGGAVDDGDEEEGLGDAEDSSEDELLLVPGATFDF